MTDRIDYLTADEEDRQIIAQANAVLDDGGRFTAQMVLCRARAGEVREIPPSDVT